MSVEFSELKLTTARGVINLQDHCRSSCIMDLRARKIVATPVVDKKVDYRGTISSQGGGKRWLSASYFSLESLLLLVCLTASLLILPLILPPLPPPPFLLLLLPIGILAVLMVLAFMPSNVRDLTHTHV
ncbi:hypothetical protein CFOL_v3_10668 [Cephalotus follicularis]|uniref:Uncharacterized protein n=1 Tax=Cephalotus follicularis TaxID=3775 RepID=A0A1Q3BGY1_CEPFO|nr:hypothetical protein CFOL_v3_10668 [Cephalotus follicularis]